MVELVDTHVSGTCASRRGGSTPPLGRQVEKSSKYLLSHSLVRWVDTSRPVGMAQVVRVRVPPWARRLITFRKHIGGLLVV